VHGVALLAHHWPGNARELRHTVHLAVLLSDSPLIRGSSIRFDGGPAWQPHCAEETLAYPLPAEQAAPLPAMEPALLPALAEVIDLRGRSLASLEEAAIRAAHERHDGNRRAISDELGLARSSLIRKLDLLGLRSAER
jgi:DNA-binding NtrC family response regulator